MKTGTSLLMSDVVDYESLVKEAFVGMAVGGLGRAMMGAGKLIVKNPLAAGGHAFTAYSTGSDLAGAVRKTVPKNRNLMRSVQKMPTVTY